MHITLFSLLKLIFKVDQKHIIGREYKQFLGLQGINLERKKIVYLGRKKAGRSIEAGQSYRKCSTVHHINLVLIFI